MSDFETVASFLETCGLAHLSSTFAKHKIDDIGLLHMITDGELKELIPFLDERKTFHTALQKDSSTLPCENIMMSSKNIEIIELETSELEVEQNFYTELEPSTKKPRLSFSVESDSTLTASSSSSNETPIGKNKSCYHKPEVSRGKLIDKHRNKLTLLRKTLRASEVSSVDEKQSKEPRTNHMENLSRSNQLVFTYVVAYDLLNKRCNGHKAQ
ncbi:uncharacterized protein LOC115232996 [Formica exsecta]|uniref:uncharacterized protein LOC115232996 n=1 Tax=Formica exsecta TaxID=72781 RepID=UPI00114287FE|nr:uncharacterized protein LOC115232996 [Formica exsecta]